jgi:CheY-like chemotaxis protein
MYTAMEKDITIIIAEDDQGHATLIEKNLKRAGIMNPIIHFENGEDVLNFLFKTGEKEHRKSGVSYLLLLDIRMPRIDGMDVLRIIKQDKELVKMPVIVITTTDEPKEIELCHKLGCNSYITKPIDYDKFVEVIKQLGLFLKIIQCPSLNGVYSND